MSEPKEKAIEPDALYCGDCLVKDPPILSERSDGKCPARGCGNKTHFVNGRIILNVQRAVLDRPPEPMTRKRFLDKWAREITSEYQGTRGHEKLVKETIAEMAPDLDALVAGQFRYLADRIESEFASYARADDVVKDIRAWADAWSNVRE